MTGMPLSNCSLLDEATAAAEAMTMCPAQSRQKKLKFLVSVSSPAGLRHWQDARRAAGKPPVLERLREETVPGAALLGWLPVAASRRALQSLLASMQLHEDGAGRTPDLLLCWYTPRAAGSAVNACPDQAAAWCAKYIQEADLTWLPVLCRTSATPRLSQSCSHVPQAWG